MAGVLQEVNTLKWSIESFEISEFWSKFVGLKEMRVSNFLDFTSLSDSVSSAWTV